MLVRNFLTNPIALHQMNHPIDGQQYTLIGDGSTPSLARGDSWEASLVSGRFTNVSKLDVFPSGTSLQGYVKTTYKTLVSKLGEPKLMTPNESDGKVLAEWVISHPVNINYVMFTIYCWKTDRIPHDLHFWHIGGRNQNSLYCFTEITGLKTTSYEEYSAEVLAGIKAKRENQPAATSTTQDVEVCF